MKLHDTQKSAEANSDKDNTGRQDKQEQKMDLLLEVIESEKLIANTVDQRFGNNASDKMYSVEYISLSGTEVDSISLDINEFKV